MGREANCQCSWGPDSADCKVLLETKELIVRGPIRRRAAIASLTHVSVRGDQLRFRTGQDQVALNLGAELAQKWARAIATPPPTLAAKLGISSATRLSILGEPDSEELRTAIAEAISVEGVDANLILAGVRTITDLNYALDRYPAYPGNPPIWIVYAKGPGKPINETEIRSTLRREGFIDTKVASVSAKLTALRFNKRGA
jgi:hypothetical protein